MKEMYTFTNLKSLTLKAFFSRLYCRTIVMFISCLLGLNMIFAQSSHVFTQDEHEFHYETDSLGLTHILGNAKIFFDESKNPCIPFISKSLVLPYGSQIDDYSVEISKPRLIKENIILAPNPDLISTCEILEKFDTNNLIDYIEHIYPESNFSFVNYMTWQGLSLANFHLTPYIYNVLEKKLYFIDTFTVTIKLDKSDEPIFPITESIEYIDNIVNSLVENTEDIPDIISQLPEPAYYFRDKIEYLIITSEELEPSFHKLLDWKRAKGVYAGIITIDQINERYEGSIQEKIKRCIYDAYKSYGLKYVVFGGDDSVIPVKLCYSSAEGKHKDYRAPSDKYYGCFNGSWNWDTNNNGIPGELGG